MGLKSFTSPLRIHKALHYLKIVSNTTCCRCAAGVINRLSRIVDKTELTTFFFSDAGSEVNVGDR